MRIIAYTTPTSALRRRPLHPLLDVAALWSAGVLATEATVWLNTATSSSGGVTTIWALSDCSQLIYVLHTVDPGYVRLTAGRLRWAPTYDGTHRAPIDIDLSALDAGAITVAVIHQHHPTYAQPVGLIANSTRIPTHDGKAHHGRVTVLDIPALAVAADRPTEAAAPATDFDRAAAAHYGMRVLTTGLSAADVDLVQAHPEAFTFEISRADLTALTSQLGGLDDWANTFPATTMARLGATLRTSPVT